MHSKNEILIRDNILSVYIRLVGCCFIYAPWGPNWDKVWHMLFHPNPGVVLITVVKCWKQLCWIILATNFGIFLIKDFLLNFKYVAFVLSISVGNRRSIRRKLCKCICSLQSCQLVFNVYLCRIFWIMFEGKCDIRRRKRTSSKCQGKLGKLWQIWAKIWVKRF